MAEISIVKAFLQAGEMLMAGDNRKSFEATRVIVENLEKTKGQKVVSRMISISRDDKKAFSY